MIDEPYDRDETAEPAEPLVAYRIEVRIFDGNNVEVGRSTAWCPLDRTEPLNGYRIRQENVYAEPEGRTVQLTFDGELTRYVVDG